MSEHDGSRRRRRPAVRWTRAQEQKAWYWYDWANSAYVTTIADGPVRALPDRDRREAAAGSSARRPRLHQDLTCSASPIAPGALPAYVITVSTILSALLLPLLGAVADRTGQQEGPARPASPGPAPPSRRCCSSAPATTGSSARSRVIGANLCLGASTVFNDSILPLISDRGRARPGLVARLGVRLPRRRAAARAQPRRGHLSTTRFGLDEGMAVAAVACSRPRSGGRLHDHPVPWAARTARPQHVVPRAGGAGPRRASASSGPRSRTCATTRWR